VSLDLTDRRIYGFATEEHLRFADVDANGHINNGAFLQLLENARVSYMRAIVRTGLPRFRVVVGRLEIDFKRQMFFPGRATACARLLEVHDRKCVIGHALFDGEGQCTAVLKAIMVSLNEETHRSMTFEPEVRTALEKFAASKDGLGS
jgi:acyl-CoA thioester hydrolase